MRTIHIGRIELSSLCKNTDDCFYFCILNRSMLYLVGTFNAWIDNIFPGCEFLCWVDKKQEHITFILFRQFPWSFIYIGMILKPLSTFEGLSCSSMTYESNSFSNFFSLYKVCLFYSYPPFFFSLLGDFLNILLF